MKWLMLNEIKIEAKTKWLMFKAWLFGFPMTFTRCGIKGKLKRIVFWDFSIKGIYSGYTIDNYYSEFSITKYDLQEYRK